MVKPMKTEYEIIINPNHIEFEDLNKKPFDKSEQAIATKKIKMQKSLVLIPTNPVKICTTLKTLAHANNIKFIIFKILILFSLIFFTLHFLIFLHTHN